MLCLLVDCLDMLSLMVDCLLESIASQEEIPPRDSSEPGSRSLTTQIFSVVCSHPGLILGVQQPSALEGLVMVLCSRAGLSGQVCTGSGV